jgi:hypothetical protein
MTDSFRAARAAEQAAKNSIEDSVSHLTSSADSPRSDDESKSQPLTVEEERNEDFRISCGAYVKSKAKPGVRVKYNLELAESLHSAGADLNGVDGDGWTALHWASSEEHLPVVRFLLGSEGIKMNEQDQEGCTALWTAAYNGVYHSCMLLLAAGASVAPRGKGHGVQQCNAATAARSMRNPTVANLIDAETALRKADETREGRLLSGEIDEKAFREEVKQAMASKNAAQRR